jgi:predicted ATPase/DNA-binding SARP family transcriptional activator
MEVGLLGPVTVPVPEGEAGPGKRARALLAVLALAGDEPLPLDELARRLWAGAMPADPASALEGLLGQLASALPEGAIERTDDGHRLDVGLVSTDAQRFADLVGQAQDAGAAGNLPLAGDFLGEAIGLWRGDALADVRLTPHLDVEATRLDEARIAALEDRCDLALQQGRHRELISGVRRLVDEHPTRERLWALLMTALYRSGRGEEAVAVYAEARETLADELGIEPGEALRQLEAGILRNDPVLGTVPGGELAPVQPRARARIPVLSTTTFGRDELVARVGGELADPAVRMVTLTGIGGCGKSRVAALVATSADEHFTDVAFLQVTEVTGGPRLLAEVALALGCKPGGDLAKSLAALADECRALVVLDNLEALPEGPDVVRRLLASSAALTLLATSRLPLQVDGEHLMPVDPLEVPGTAASLTTIAGSPSVQLFVDRARSADPDFRLAGQEHDVAQLCFLLDGLPLALELAAARVKLRSLDRIIDGLRDNLDTLTSGSDAAPERHRTMSSVIRWSYDRLTPAGRLVCDRLALFERGFTIESVEALCPDVPGVVEAIASIVDARLIRSMESRAEVRFVVLGTVRAFARERLLAHIDLSRSHELLAAHLTDRVEVFATQLYGPDSTLTLARFDDDAADIEAAVDWALDAGRRSVAVELLLASLECWVAAGRHNEALGMTIRALDHVPHQGPDAPRLLAAATMLSSQLSDHDQAKEYGRLALELAEKHGDRRSAAVARTFLGGELIFSGDTPEGVELVEAALGDAEALDLYPLSTQALHFLAMARGMRGDVDGERRAHEARLAVVRTKGDLARTAGALNTLAEIALDDADGETARVFAAEALAIAEQRRPTVGRDAAITLARAAVVLGDLPEARRQLVHALELSDRLGQAFAVAQCIRAGGCLAAALGQADSAVRLFAAAQTLSESPGGGEEPPEQDLAAGLAEARAELGPQAAGRAWLLGQAMPLTAVRALLAPLLAELPEAAVTTPG